MWDSKIKLAPTYMREYVLNTTWQTSDETNMQKCKQLLQNTWQRVPNNMNILSMGFEQFGHAQK